MSEKINQDHYDQELDKLLKIKTTGRDDTISNHINYPYEPTPYAVLERLARAELMGKRDTLLDYGCGKGRVDFYLSYQTRCRSIGIDYDKRMVERAMQNKEEGVSAGRCSFLCENAVNFAVQDEVSICYFFNPFSVEVLKSVIARIMESYYRNPREIKLLFYYPSDEYISYLMMEDRVMFDDEIDCRDLFDAEDNEREKIMIFQISE